MIDDKANAPAPDLEISFDEKRIDAIFADYDTGSLPGVCVGIAHRGRPLYRKGFGLASMDLPHVLSPATRMRIGSVSKHFTSFAYLLLCEDRLAGIDDPLGSFFPEFPRALHSITMEQLMGNISGIRDVTDIRFRFGGFEGTPVSSEQLLSLYREMDGLDAEPGTTWMYNNGGFIVLSAVIEKVAGAPLAEVMRERIFAPIGMNDSLLRAWDTDFLANSATPHTLVAPGRYEKRYWGVEFAGAGGVVSTIDDMLRWLAHMDQPATGSALTWNEMTRPRQLRNGSSTGYGLGLILGRFRGARTIQHGGGWMGGNAQMIKVVEAGLDVVVITNRSDAITPLLADKVLGACLPRLHGNGGPTDAGAESFSLFKMESSSEPVAAAETLATGNFRSPTTGRVVQLKGQSGQQIVSIDGHDLPYRRNGENLYPARVWEFILRHIRLLGDTNRPSAIELDDFGNIDRLEALRAEDSGEERIVGLYRVGVAQAQAEIFKEEHRLVMRTTSELGSMRYGLVPLGEGVFRVESSISIFLDCVICFENDDGFWLSSYNTRRLRFDRMGRE